MRTMRRPVVVGVVLLALALAAPASAGSSGWLDTGFGSNGSVVLRSGAGEQALDAAGITRSPTGTVALSNVALPPGPEGPRSGYRLDGLTSGGRRDPAFNGGQSVRRAFGDTGRAVAILPRVPGEGFLVVGYEITATAVRVVAVAHRWDGSVVTGFGNNGRAATTYFTTLDSALARAMITHTHAALLPDGRVRVCATVANPTDTSIRLAGILQEGSPDPTVGSGGVRELDLGSATSCNAIVTDPSGRIVVAGTGRVDGRRATIVGRFLADGMPDATFGNGGRRTLLWANREFTAHQLVRLGTSGFAVGGQAIDAGAPPIAYTARLTAGGAIDGGYGYGGVYRYPGGSGGSVLRSLDVVGNNRLITGVARLAGPGDVTETLIRIDAGSGRLDPTFGQNGVVPVHHAAIDTVTDGALRTTTLGDRLGTTGEVLVQRRMP